MKRSRHSRDLQAEIDAHLQLEADRLREEGTPAEAAEAAARRAFGNRTIVEERFYESRRWMFTEHLVRDLRFAGRLLARDARFSFLAMLGLALGIGVSTAIFAVINAAFQAQGGGVQDTASLVGIARLIDGRWNWLTYPDYVYLRDRSRSFRDVAAESGRNKLVLSPPKGSAEAEVVQGRFESANFLSAAGLHPALGRSFSRDEEMNGNVAVLQFGFWKKRFGGDPAVLGMAVVLNARPLTIVGVADPRMGANDPTDFYLPLGSQPALLRLGDWLHDPKVDWLMVSAWMRPGVALAQARAEADVLGQAYAATFVVSPGGVNPQKRREILAVITTITIAVSMILLIACSNLTNLLLARAVMRSREIGVRLSLGASRGRLVRQLLTESMLLAAGGGVLGLVFSKWLAGFLLVWTNAAPGMGLDLRLDPRVVAYAIALSTAAGLSFGLPPAFAATRGNVLQTLHGGSAMLRRGSRGLLVIVPLAVSLMLLLAAGVAVRNVQRSWFTGPKFGASQLIGVSFRLSQQGYDEPRTRQFQDSLRDRIAAMPGVVSVAEATSMPLSNGFGWFRMAAEGKASSQELGADYNIISPGFFETIGASIVRGRGLTAADREGLAPVALVNEDLARRYWPGQDAIGRHIRLRNGGTWFEIVGVAPDLEDATGKFSSVRPTVYVPYAQGKEFTGPMHVSPPSYESQFLIRTSADPAVLRGALRQTIRAADPSLLVRIESIEEMLEARVGPMKTISLLLSALGVLALLMAAVGIYAILSYAVSQRTREIGIRSALGATRGDILAFMMRRATISIVWGIGGGLVAAVTLTRVFAHSMTGFGELDTLTCVTVSVLLAAVALLASYMPARKALRVDPAEALRWE